MEKRLVGWRGGAVAPKLFLLFTAYYLLPAGTLVWADDPGLKAEIEVLKERLAKLEEKLSAGEGDQIVPPTAGEGAAVIQLPSGLQGVQMSGFIDTTFTYNLNEPETNINTLRVFDTRANSFMLNNAELVIEKPVSSGSPVGFRTDIDWGTDAEVVGSVTTGLGANAHTHGETPETAVSDEVELQQAYVEYLAPVGNGLDVKAGKFVTLHGAEVIESKDNWNISRSYLFGYAIPFSHTGIRTAYPWTERFSTMVGVSNGWDLVDDTNQGKTIELGFASTPLDGVTLGSTYMVGAEQAGDNSHQRHLLDIVLGWQPIEPLQLKLNYDYGSEDDGASAVVHDNAVWQGLAAYARYAVNDRLALAARGEFFNDADGVRTAFTSGINGITDDDIKLYEFTLTGEYKLHEHLIGRLEYRHDTANARIFRSDDQGQRSYQDTIAMEFIAPF